MFRRKISRSREFRKSNQVIDFEKAREARREKREALAKITQKQEGTSKRSTYKINRKRGIYTAIMLIIIAVIGVSILNIISVNDNYKEVLAEKENLETEKERLTYELENADSEEYIEHQARMMLKMIKPGEIYYVVPEGKE